VAPKSTLSPESVFRIEFGATLWSAGMMNLTIPPTLTMADIGEYIGVVVPVVVTVGTMPGGQATARTLGGPASDWPAASIGVELPPPQAASGINRASEARASIDTSSVSRLR
jgi:hypothetical protein